MDLTTLNQLTTHTLLTPLEGGIFAEGNRIAGEAKGAIVAIVTVGVIAVVGSRVLNSGLSMAAVAVGLVGGGLAYWAVSGGGLETIGQLLGQTVQKR